VVVVDTLPMALYVLTPTMMMTLSSSCEAMAAEAAALNRETLFHQPKLLLAACLAASAVRASVMSPLTAATLLIRSSASLTPKPCSRNSSSNAAACHCACTVLYPPPRPDYRTSP
jgi:hypothetical protein